MNFLSKINKALDKVNPIKTIGDIAGNIGDKTLNTVTGKSDPNNLSNITDAFA
jgi:hypothetical protein